MRRLAVVASLAFQLGACGGSSSETPPPLEPDPERLRARPAGDPAQNEPGAEGAGQAEPNLAAPIPALPDPSAPRRRGSPSSQPPSSGSTWGGGRTPPELAPEPR